MLPLCLPRVWHRVAHCLSGHRLSERLDRPQRAGPVHFWHGFLICAAGSFVIGKKTGHPSHLHFCGLCTYLVRYALEEVFKGAENELLYRRSEPHTKKVRQAVRINFSTLISPLKMMLVLADALPAR